MTKQEKVEMFFKIKQQIKEMKKQEDELRKQLLEMSKGKDTIKAKGFEVKITDYLQFRLDKEAIVEDMGKEFIAKYEKEVQCTKIEVKKIA